MPRTLLMVLGGLLLVVGIFWTLQGVGLVGGSAMSGDSTWTVIGAVCAVAGAVLLGGGLRAGRRPPR